MCTGVAGPPWRRRENWGSENQHQNADTLVTAMAVVNNKLFLFKNNTLFFIPDPEVLGLVLSGSMKRGRLIC